MAQINKIGRRKTSTARVYVQPGSGLFVVNGKKMEDYFPVLAHQMAINFPMVQTGNEGKFDIKVTVRGGGLSGQADAIALGITRVIDSVQPEMHTVLKSHGLFTRDDRMVERKKYGRPKARKRFQFSKR
jgi:small subunit ribosomal protein S9